MPGARRARPSSGGVALVKGLGVAAAIAVLIGLIAARSRAWPVVETQQWGGLLVTLVVAVTGIVASLPLGILLALGPPFADADHPAVLVIFIEIWRGVPLITVLFMASVMLPLFLPEGINFDKLLRALVGVGAVLGRLYGRDGARRTAGHSQGAI